MKARENCFRTTVLDALPYRFPVLSMEELLVRFGGTGFRGAIVGPHGSGKTTLIDGLCKELAQRGYGMRRVTLTRDLTGRGPGLIHLLRAISCHSGERLLVIDGADLLPSCVWRMAVWSRRCSGGGLLVTSHRPLPCIAEIYSTHTSPALLRELLRDICPDTEFREEALRDLYRRFDGNLREVFRCLYDLSVKGGPTHPSPFGTSA